MISIDGMIPLHFILQALKEYGIVIDKNSTCSHKIRIDQYLKLAIQNIVISFLSNIQKNLI